MGTIDVGGDMSIILSHGTARAFHRAVADTRGLQSYPARKKCLKLSAPDAGLRATAREKLAARGVPACETDALEVLVASAGSRRQSKRLRCRVFAGELPAGTLLSLGDGVFVADIRLCALQAAQHLTFCELVEYYFELCGGYSMPFDDGDDYVDRPAPTSTARLGRFFEAASRHPGSNAARRALKYVRDGSRSPLETALVMTLVLPRRLGGLGIRDVQMDYRIPVGNRMRDLTRRTRLYCDAFIKRGKLDIEYHGFFHDAEEQAVIDDERVNALRAIGVSVVAIRRGGFFDRLAFERFTRSVQRELGIRASSLPEGFDGARERLRRFVLRRWL